MDDCDERPDAEAQAATRGAFVELSAKEESDECNC